MKIPQSFPRPKMLRPKISDDLKPSFGNLILTWQCLSLSKLMYSSRDGALLCSHYLSLTCLCHIGLFPKRNNWRYLCDGTRLLCLWLNWHQLFFPGPVVGELLDKIIPMLTSNMNPEKDAEVRLKLFNLVSRLVQNAAQTLNSTNR